MCTVEGLKEMADWYAAGQDLREPYLSPMYGDMTGLPPLLIHVGDAEILRDDAVRVADRARAAGVDVTLEIWDEMPHVWHAFAGLLPEADQAITRIGSWLDERFTRAGRPDSRDTTP
jgi:acetyl esterase/lipase